MSTSIDKHAIAEIVYGTTNRSMILNFLPHLTYTVKRRRKAIILELVPEDGETQVREFNRAEYKSIQNIVSAIQHAYHIAINPYTKWCIFDEHGRKRATFDEYTYPHSKPFYQILPENKELYLTCRRS